GRNPVANISDVETRDMVVYEMQAHVVNATGNDYASRSTFSSLTNTTKNWNIDYISSLGVNTIWLQPFHPIGAKSDCNSGDPGSPYSIKNLFQVAEYLGSDGTRATAMSEFTNFVIAAQAKGVKVICDVIFNHVATDIEIERDPDNPANLYSTPSSEMRNVKYQWFSRYTGTRSGCPTSKPQSDWGNYHYSEPATSSSEIGPAPADRNDFVWPDAFDLFWGTYSALGNINDTSDGAWTASTDVKKMVDYYAYFVQYWLEKTGGKIGGFRCDFAQGVPRQAWQYLINRAKTLKPELYFVSESLDGGNIAYRAWKGGFDALNENQLWAIVEDTDIQSTDLRTVIDQRKTQFGLALILRGTMNHDQGPWLGRKWDAVAMHSVFCAIDGTPQMYESQELGYDALGQFSRERVEFGRTIPDIRNYHNYNSLWAGRSSGDNTSLWHRYKDANLGRSRSVALRVANQYYLDRTAGQGAHPKIFSVLKYTQFGWDPKDQEVVLAFVNLQPGTANSGTFNVNVAPIYLDPTRTYNVKNLASTSPTTYLWPSGRSGSDIAANGIYVGFSADKGQEGSIAQFLKLEEQGGSGGSTNLDWIGNMNHWPLNGSITSVDDLWINIESHPQGAASAGSVVYSADNVNWTTVPLITNGQASVNDAWHVNLGPFAAGTVIKYAAQIVQTGGTNFWDNRGGSNYTAIVNSIGNGQSLVWIGTVAHWPTNTAITADDDLWIDIQAYPTGAATAGFVVYSSDNGASWPTRAMSFNFTSSSNDFWHANLGKFASGATIQYAVSLTGITNNQLWANNNGSNYIAIVNGAGSNRSVQWVGNTIHRGLLVPDVSEIGLEGGAFRMFVDAAHSNSQYQVLASSNLTSWFLVTNITAGSRSFEFTNGPAFDPLLFYRTEGQSIPTTEAVFEGDDMIVRAESWPQGRGISASIVYSSNGQNWNAVPMTYAGTNGNNDVWEANLGFFPKGISVQYAIDILDDQGFNIWDNNNSRNHSAPIRDPNQPDSTPPTLSYSPSNTTTAASSLDVTITSTDDYDPSPSIFYTTNGVDPTTNSALYSAPVHVIANLTIKAFARDAAGNESTIQSMIVKVNESFLFGSAKPYSVNPTLGHSVVNGGITIDGSPSDWNTNMLVALDMANDDPRTLGDNWTTHEAPIDFSHLWAAWDDNNLYLAWQYVDITDIIDPSNAGSAGGGKISSN
ncbi:MAG: alpha-amylase family glycosyl hydrolase, partial [Lentisphaerota bacterium]